MPSRTHDIIYIYSISGKVQKAYTNKQSAYSRMNTHGGDVQETLLLKHKLKG